MSAPTSKAQMVKALRELKKRWNRSRGCGCQNVMNEQLVVMTRQAVKTRCTREGRERTRARQRALLDGMRAIAKWNSDNIMSLRDELSNAENDMRDALATFIAAGGRLEDK